MYEILFCGNRFFFLPRLKVLFVRFAGNFKSFEIAGNPHKELILIVDHIIIGSGSAVVDIRFQFIADYGLIFQQFSVLLIRLCINVEFDKRIIMYRNHVIKPKHTQSSVVQFQNMLAGLMDAWFGFGDSIGTKYLY